MKSSPGRSGSVAFTCVLVAACGVVTACGGDDSKGKRGGSPDGGDGSGGTGAGGRASGGAGPGAGGDGAGSTPGGTGGAGNPDGGTTTTIGPAGGTVTAGGATVTVPSGALSADTVLGIAEVTAPVALPAGYTARSPIYELTPHGQLFSSPVALSLAYTGTADTVLTLTDPTDTAWEPVASPTFAAGTAEVSTSSFSYYVVAQAQGPGVVRPLYSIAPGFNEYVKADGATPFETSGACDKQYWNTPQIRHSECRNGGEHRAVTVTGRASCTGLTATDALGAFEWTCEVLGGAATMVSTGFAPGKGLSTLLDFTAGAFKGNAVTVVDGAATVLTTPDEIWWPNPVVIDNDGVDQSTAGTIYLVTQDSAARYGLSTDGAALVVAPGRKLTPPAVDPVVGNDGRVVVGGFGNWFEGTIEGAGQAYTGLYVTAAASQSVVHSSRVVGLGVGIHLNGERMRLERSKVSCQGATGATGVQVQGSGHLLRDVAVAQCNTGVQFAASVAVNLVEGLLVSGGVAQFLGSNHILSDITVHHSPDVGIGIGSGNANLMMHATTAHNLGDGLATNSSSVLEPMQIIGFLATENRRAGMALTHNYILRDTGSFSNTHYGVLFDFLGSSGNVFVGAFGTGYDGGMLGNYYENDPDGCYLPASYASPGDCAGSRPDTSAGAPNGLLSLANGSCMTDTNSTFTGFNAPAQGSDHPLPLRSGPDSVNASDNVDGLGAFASITDFLDFENPYRGWGAEGPAAPSCMSQGPCSSASQGSVGCGIYDYRLRQDGTAFIARGATYPTGNQVVTHRFVAGRQLDHLTEAACNAFFSSPVIEDYNGYKRCTATFLANAREILGDLRGNENLLCESGETCLFTPNLASYQGEGPLVPAGQSFVDGTLTGVTLLEHTTNGTTAPHRP